MAHKWDPICPSPQGLVRPVRRDATGRLGPTRGQARGSRYRGLGGGWYVDAAAPALPEQRILEQAAKAPADAAVTGWAALRLYRGGFFDGLKPDGRTPMPVPLVVPRTSKMRGNDEVVLSREPLRDDEVSLVEGIRCTSPERAVFDEMRRTRDLREAVVVADMAAAALITSVSRVTGYWSAHRSWRRASLVERALGLVSERSRSPQETRYRLIWVLDAGLPVPLVNQPIWDLAGSLLGIADLLDEEAGLVGEFDGADHRRLGRHTADLGRQDGFERVELEVCRATGLDVLRPDLVVSRIHFRRSRARWLRPDERAWTITPPPTWETPQSLDAYLEEREFFEEVRRNDERLGLV